MTLLQQLLTRLVSAGEITAEEREALLACVNVAYEDCPEPESLVLKRLMSPFADPTMTRAESLHAAGIGGLEPGSVGRAMDEAQERTGCPYIGLLKQSDGEKVAIALRIGTDGGRRDVMSTITDYLDQEELVGALNALTRDECIRALRRKMDASGLLHHAVFHDALATTLQTSPKS
jgi:hypothetical protein